MAIHLFEKAEQQTDVKGPKLCLLGGYEDGSVILRQLNEATNTWEILWSLREHVESVMAFSLSPDRTFALSGSADDKIVRYPLFPKAADRPTPLTVSSKRQGKASIAIRRDSKVSAYGGWDGK
ncbi:Astra associated protein 1 Asa1 [Tilletia horrida]|uniref:ASTRA-associated protein 1 n=1 Tax=Tilletia horrida TaxID=155126 RepID=A0AAN6GUT7_9BASI|nr:Astra associated protein 1 Asa1 [Tilletia horrida]